MATHTVRHHEDDESSSSYTDDPFNPGGLHGFLVEQRGRLGLRQIDVANELPVTLRHYRNLESGHASLHPDVLERLVDILEMNPADRRQLYRLTVQHDPPVSHGHQLAELDEITRVWVHAYVYPMKNPTIFADGCGRILAYNPAYAAIWEGIEPGESHPTKSFTRFVLFHPQAREVLVDWQSAWLPPTLGKLILAARLQPDNRYLRDAWEAIRADATLSTIVPAGQPHLLELCGTDPDEQSGRLLAGGRDLREVRVSTVRPRHGRELGYQSTTFELVEAISSASADRS
jgi:transcriptional regulator with XRE-family HTH domain